MVTVERNGLAASEMLQMSFKMDLYSGAQGTELFGQRSSMQHCVRDATRVSFEPGSMGHLSWCQPVAWLQGSVPPHSRHKKTRLWFSLGLAWPAVVGRSACRLIVENTRQND